MARRIEIGNWVRPVGPTRGNLEIGVVRERYNDHRGVAYLVYWPELDEIGAGWREHDLEVL